MIDPGLKSKVVLVTGGNNPYGIGAAIAMAFACQDAAVFIHYFRQYIDLPLDNKNNLHKPGLPFFFEQQKKTADNVVSSIREK